MDDRGLLADTLVVVMGEFGRTPQINKDTGRDHFWGSAACSSSPLASAAAWCSADGPASAYVTRRPVAPADVACTIYEAVGVNPHTWLTHPGRPARRGAGPGEPRFGSCTREGAGAEDLLFGVEQATEVTSAMDDPDNHKPILLYAVGNDVTTDSPEEVTLILHVRACVSELRKLGK
ncbi:MAG: DUF1501 domain-containing protein [Gemmataceae bacterium]